MVSYILMGLLDLQIPWQDSGARSAVTDCMTGLLATLPLFIGYALVLLWVKKAPSSVYARFQTEVVVPLCREISFPLACVLALLSGFGEELFFRGALSAVITASLGESAYAPVLSMIITSVLFAWVHFIGQERRFGTLIPLYALAGGYLWFVVALTSSLLPAMVCHGVYNLVVMLRTARTMRV